MKKLLNILLLLSFYTVGNAQSATDTAAPYKKELFNRGRLSFGVIAGMSYTGLRGSELGYIFAENKATYKPGFHVGITVDNQLGKHFWLKHELIFNSQSAGVQLSDSVNGQYSSKLTMNYLELYPLNATWYLHGFQLYAGPYLSTLLGARQQRKDAEGHTYNDHDIFGSAGNNESESKYLQKFNVGVNAGLQYTLPIGLFVSVRYTHGLTDLFQFANSYTNNDSKRDKIKIYNNGFLFSLGYTIK